MVLIVTEIAVTSARCMWNEPSQLNGPLLRYELVSYDLANQSVSKVEWSGLAREQLLTSLRPYFRYVDIWFKYKSICAKTFELLVLVMLLLFNLTSSPFHNCSSEDQAEEVNF